MYIPVSFQNDDLAALHELIRKNSFAVMVTPGQRSVSTTHLPFLLEKGRGEKGVLLAHMARANPHWQQFDSASESLVIFQGPHCYISPSWYEHPASVPTWNYCAVHASGPVKRITDPEKAKIVLEKMIDSHESSMPVPWQLEQTGDKLDRLMREIVAFELTIVRLEGKFKLSQNRSNRDRQRVINVLCRSEDPQARNIAGLMKAGMQD